jgi:hypothetical protein
MLLAHSKHSDLKVMCKSANVQVEAWLLLLFAPYGLVEAER